MAHGESSEPEGPTNSSGQHEAHRMAKVFRSLKSGGGGGLETGNIKNWEAPE